MVLTAFVWALLSLPVFAMVNCDDSLLIITLLCSIAKFVFEQMLWHQLVFTWHKEPITFKPIFFS